ncbi:MAG: nicotinamide-nucleotide amidohydrolase family protein [Spirochaetia bacterium]|nr:nicotinamide-nucleotide amidohydrolase family protein [Spirochaetia bacterium]
MAFFQILSTGTELSSGRTGDVNGPYLAERLEQEGFDCRGICLLPDEFEILKEHLENFIASEKISFIILTGGLGPTADDITIDLLSEVTGKNIIDDDHHLKKLLKLIRTHRKNLDLSIARRQIRTLEDSVVLKNRTGLAPGIFTEINTANGKKYISAMPGYPQEMNPMFENFLLPELKKSIPIQKKYRKDFYLYGASETGFQKNFIEKQDVPHDFEWGVASQNSHLKVFFQSKDSVAVENIYSSVRKEFEEQFLEASVLDTLHEYCTEHRITIGGSESCTGGLIGKLLTDLPGSSVYFKGSIVSYANEVKTSLLGVSESTLKQYGAVSEQCAIEMAEGAFKKFNTAYTFSVTGIAGPEGGTEEKPVGTVWTALCSGKTTETRKLFFPADRDRIRRYTAYTLLFNLYRMIRKQQDLPQDT